MKMADALPRIALTLGDVSGIGPEVVARACLDPAVRACCRPIVVGHPRLLQRALDLTGAPDRVEALSQIDEPPTRPEAIACWNPTGDQALDAPPAVHDGRAGQAACEYLSAAAEAALDGRIDALTTAPLSKAALRLAGLYYPGHTEILAELCGVREYAMMLYLSAESGVPTSVSSSPGGESTAVPAGAAHALGVVHATLHTSLRSVPEALTTSGIAEKIRLLDRFLRRVGCRSPRLGVCALNPHAGEEGLFGDEEARIIAPAVRQEAATGIAVRGPLPADTLVQRAVAGEFDGVVAMYHDQGHIPLKLIGWNRAVNVTLGLPIIRTSPSHGTAFDIAWQGRASPAGMVEAIRIAALLARTRHV